MLCTNCKTGADLRASLLPSFQQQLFPLDLAKLERHLEEAARDSGTGQAWIDTLIAACAALETADQYHGRCTGGEQGCGCQHRGTAYETHYADRGDRGMSLDRATLDEMTS